MPLKCPPHLPIMVRFLNYPHTSVLPQKFLNVKAKGQNFLLPFTQQWTNFPRITTPLSEKFFERERDGAGEGLHTPLACHRTLTRAKEEAVSGCLPLYFYYHNSQGLKVELFF